VECQWLTGLSAGDDFGGLTNVSRLATLSTKSAGVGEKRLWLAGLYVNKVTRFKANASLQRPWVARLRPEMSVKVSK